MRLIGAIERATRALVGPIIGKVTSTTAVVLLEVEDSAIVTMVMTDILSRQTFRFSQRLQGRKPKSFVAKGLRPERRYLIHLKEFLDGCSIAGLLLPYRLTPKI